MALSRRSSNRFQNAIWPGFVDAMTGLLLVLMFVLTIFMVIQFVLRQQITGQETELDALNNEVAALTATLGLARDTNASLTADLDAANAEATRQAGRIAALIAERDAQDQALAQAQTQITQFEAQVAGLLSERRDALANIAGLEAEQARLLTQQEALNLALAQARTEIDEGAEAARLAAARREALEALIADLESENDANTARITALEADQLTSAAAAEALRERLANADSELTAMTLNLERQRQEAENTLTLLAAARAAQAELDARNATLTSELEELQGDLGEEASEAERQAALLALANEELAAQEALSAESQRQVALLNEQITELRTQVGNLQSLLNLAEEADREAQVQIETLGAQLNTALARVVSEERRRRALEEAERIRLEAEAARLEEEAERLAAEAENLSRFKSDFFGELRQILEGQDRIRIEGDRFIFASEVLFEPGSADLSPAGEAEIANIADILRSIADDIPEGLDWVIRVDGHTDNIPLNPGARFADNWELSQARALSVVRFMSSDLDIDPRRLAANGFGEYQPLNPADTPEARAQNRRIELKLTER
ncbi:chemotaxis protein MotB [Loktanella sp. PT4BL]|jgi:chemotaxis protein MotB|uniref:peptidoglycan -binding protein n=1 Tax=Loktanella sp. PT4BL TaxID=2135611 RepID=UPI000D7660D6|nr:peptidoglycan -binding protein [Loktanella sp. PT4BL]PXW67488.1 chemotaxis protein MotB [Loktanella sp. PT4BL]